jgi:hypothetical protein
MAGEVQLTEEEYLRLCKFCDFILDKRDSIISTAIPSLHIIREHPLLLKKYSYLIKSSATERFKIWVRIGVEWIINLTKSLFSNNPLWLRKGFNLENTDFLFISHMVNENYGKDNSDFYFDKLPYTMHQEGYNSAIALINHTKCEKPAFLGQDNDSELTFFLFSKRLSFGSEISMLLEIIKESAQLRKIRQQVEDPALKKAINSAIQDSFTGNAANALRIYKQIQQLVKTIRPKVIVTTYEGHGWERLAFAAAREFDPSIKCIGYQHSTIFRLQHAIRRSMSPKFNPDTILCSGLVGKNQLEKSLDLKDVSKFVLGSNRSVDILKMDKGKEIDKTIFPNVCLVIPEGHISECNILFEFSKECAEKYPCIKFIWRLHPLIEFSTLKNRNEKLRILPQNVVVSTCNLMDDISKCNMALYRGTTTIILAAGSGLKPIYLAQRNEMAIDPLYEINDPCNYVYNVDDFQKIVNRDLTWINNEDIEEYCSRMFQPINSEVLKQQFPS